MSCAYSAQCVLWPFMLYTYASVRWLLLIAIITSYLLMITQLVNANNNVLSLRVTFRIYYKHSYNQPPVSIIIQRQPSFCPVSILLDYMSHRGSCKGPLFILRGLPVQRKYFCDLLTTAIRVKSARAKSWPVLDARSLHQIYQWLNSRPGDHLASKSAKDCLSKPIVSKRRLETKTISVTFRHLCFVFIRFCLW